MAMPAVGPNSTEHGTLNKAFDGGIESYVDYDEGVVAKTKAEDGIASDEGDDDGFVRETETVDIYFEDMFNGVYQDDGIGVRMERYSGKIRVCTCLAK